MCGIFAYIGDRQAVKLLIAALKRLEYRGYDSAGVGVHGGEAGKPLKIKKKVGKVVNLEDECNNAGDAVSGTVGIAHTRWATHGKPNDTNSHPHTTKSKGIAVVHNGVIENYRALREELINKGYEFSSDTDTELLAHLVEDLRAQMPAASWRQVVAMALSLVTGAYGVVFMFEDQPDLLIGGRKGSPLLLGVGDGEYMLASDASAIIEHTKNCIYLREGDLVEVTRKTHKIFKIDDIVKKCANMATDNVDSDHENPMIKLEISLEQIEKGGYKHFMLKEILDQPNALRNAMRGRVYQADGDNFRIKLGGMEKPLEEFKGPDGKPQSALERMASARRLIVCACGTSWHSGLIFKYALESLAKVPVEVEYASEFRYRRPLVSSSDVLIAVSQSGETADTLEAIKIAKESGCMAVGVVNVVGSSIARETAAGMYLHSGPEIGVASTKAFTGQVMALLMLSLEVARQRGELSEADLNSYCSALQAIPDTIEKWLPSVSEKTKVIAKYFRLANNALFTGCGIQFPVALEGALKLKEISYIHAEGFPAAEVKHGALTLVNNFMPVVCIAMKSDPAYGRILINHRELKLKGAALIVITDKGNTDFDEIASFTIYCPSAKLQFEPVLVAIPLQLLSYYIADMRECSIDQPRNLAKSVTVE
jgi:glucosamine--fructose-6-phosphate aminotransferase (isomerizing)